MAFVLHLLLPEDWFMDIGANAGAYSVLAGGACGASGLAVEPVPSTFRRLTMQLRVNALESRVKAINAGCSDHTGQLWFSTDHDTVNGVVQSDYPGPKAALPITTVDILAGDQTPLWMKIDVEGHDAEVLRGATAVLARPELLALVIEASPAGPTPVILAAAGFLPSAYDPFTRTLTQGNWQELKEWQTVIAVRNYDLVAQRLSGAKPFEVLGREI
jgi:FkbM family methyltransferase